MSERERRRRRRRRKSDAPTLKRFDDELDALSDAADDASPSLAPPTLAPRGNATATDALDDVVDDDDGRTMLEPKTK